MKTNISVQMLTFLCIFILSANAPNAVVNAIVTNEIQTRRATLSNAVSSLATLTFASQVNAADIEERAVIPGTGMRAPLRSVTVGSDGGDASPWYPQSLITQLGKSRIGAKELTPLSPSFVPFAADNELYYDPFLFGSWDVTSTLKQKIYPYGTQYLPSTSLYEGSPRNRMEKPGDTTSYELHFFSSSTPESAVGDKKGSIVDLKQSIPKTKIIADRVFNTKSMSVAYKQLSRVEDVTWDYKKDPTRLTLQFGTLGADMQPLGERRGEVYINARKSEVGKDPDTNEPIFCSSERVRSVLLIPGDVVVSDTETITEYRVVNGSDGNHIKAASRISVYLTPNPNSREGLLWQDVGGRSVAFFDYDIDFRRKLDDSKPFVLTPKGGIQFGE